MGLIFPERGGSGLNINLFVLHKTSANNIEIESFRICRQLLALGLFREPKFSDTIDPPTFVGSTLSVQRYQLHEDFVRDLQHWSSTQQH